MVVPLFIGKYVLAVDDHAIFFTEILLELCHSAIEADMQFFGWVEHGCVRKLESHNKTSLIVFGLIGYDLTGRPMKPIGLVKA